MTKIQLLQHTLGMEDLLHIRLIMGITSRDMNLINDKFCELFANDMMLDFTAWKQNRGYVFCDFLAAQIKKEDGGWPKDIYIFSGRWQYAYKCNYKFIDIIEDMVNARVQTPWFETISHKKFIKRE